MMDALSLTISLGLVGAALILILYPLWRQTRPAAMLRADRAGKTLEEYEVRYQAALAAIKDLMFDYEMGKVSVEDYEILLSKAKLEAAGLRQQIDLLSHQIEVEIDPTLEAEIEALVTQLRDNGLNSSESLLREVNAEIELLKNAASAAEVPGRTCPNCAQFIQASDVFCSGCGQPLADADRQGDETPNACPACGYAYQADDAFCARCGLALTQTVEQQVPEEAKL